jgi:hypothetical protein
MSGFSAEWLALREPYDTRARNRTVLKAVGAMLAGYTSVAVVDLACGAGATLRAIASQLPSRQSWRLVDNNLSLLARAAPSVPIAGQGVVTVPIDIARDLEAALDGPVDLVTTSALLDLVSTDWLERFATEAAVRSLPVYAALSYDGEIAFDPHEALDARLIESFNRHQRNDKGFGRALGPSAVAEAMTRFKALGYEVVHGPSDWLFGPGDDEMQSEFLTGLAAAARETGDLSLADVIGWLERRRDHIASGRSSIRVGHVDFLARPTTTR